MCSEACEEKVQAALSDNYDSIDAHATRLLRDLKAPTERLAACDFELKWKSLELAQMCMQRIGRTCRAGCALKQSIENVRECCRNLEKP